ncbi:hypothetical protein ACFL49_00975 [Candidatus Omnitrophota bacterium]
MKISKIDIVILVDLYKSVNGLRPYVFFQRYRYGPSTVFKSILEFVKKNLVLEKDDKLIITKIGREFVEKNRFLFNKNKFDRIPEEFLVQKLAVNEPYMPSISKLSKEVFNL